MELGAMGVAKPTEIQASFRSGWLRYFRVALSSAGGAAVIIALFALLERQPATVRLLVAWGPWPLVALATLAIFGAFMRRTSDSLQTSFAALVQNSQQTAQAHQATAQAVTQLATATERLANQGSESAQEVRRLAIFAAQEFPSVYERFDRTDSALKDLSKSVNELVVRGRDGH